MSIVSGEYRITNRLAGLAVELAEDNKLIGEYISPGPLQTVRVASAFDSLCQSTHVILVDRSARICRQGAYRIKGRRKVRWI
ncbi:hypothetical protein EI94DRAFT_812875 [Lactarius quietus]|nr:hypothetical protein EI94DRAFT_812875 [Lactarius quietus]